jgi:rhodanese-related sulfurtransferase
LDVREDWEFEEFSITKYNIPLYNIPEHISEFEKWKNDKIIVFCRSGKRGGQAQKFLNQNGYKNIYNLIGGIEAYLMVTQK